MSAAGPWTSLRYPRPLNNITAVRANRVESRYHEPGGRYATLFIGCRICIGSSIRCAFIDIVCENVTEIVVRVVESVRRDLDLVLLRNHKKEKNFNAIGK